MPEEFSNADIMHKLGGIEVEFRHASESRGVLHDKIERLAATVHETAHEMTRLGTNLEITAEVATQARNEVLGFRTEFREKHLPAIKAATSFQEEAKPILDTMRMVRTIVVVLAALVTFLMGSGLALFIFARDLLRTLIAIIIGI